MCIFAASVTVLCSFYCMFCICFMFSVVLCRFVVYSVDFHYYVIWLLFSPFVCVFCDCIFVSCILCIIAFCVSFSIFCLVFCWFLWFGLAEYLCICAFLDCCILGILCSLYWFLCVCILLVLDVWYVLAFLCVYFCILCIYVAFLVLFSVFLLSMYFWYFRMLVYSAVCYVSLFFCAAICHCRWAQHTKNQSHDRVHSWY